MTGNPDKALLLRFLDNPGAPTVVDSNPLAAALRCRLLEVDPKGFVRLDFEPDETFLQGNGAVQGGAVAAMLDFAMAFAALAALPGEQGGATTSMTVNYLKAVRAGRYEAIGRIERKGRSVVFARGELRPVGSLELAATASSVLAVIS
ncbi:MAG TPA: PaaI family thioesterase [Alphaproteobacteria bacterium]|nr:PaaI family thioesterase [Alphaproteobacteria bacterium]